MTKASALWARNSASKGIIYAVQEKCPASRQSLVAPIHPGSTEMCLKEHRSQQSSCVSMTEIASWSLVSSIASATKHQRRYNGGHSVKKIYKES